MGHELVEILIVEDNPSDLELAMHALMKHNLANHIHVARDGAEAVDFFFANGDSVPRPAVVLLDLKLPKLNGIEVLRRLKGDPRTSLIPVIVLTASREEQDVITSYQLGVNSYIVKPVDFEQFTEAVRVLGLHWLLLNQPPPV